MLENEVVEMKKLCAVYRNNVTGKVDFCLQADWDVWSENDARTYADRKLWTLLAEHLTHEQAMQFVALARG